MTGIIYSVGIGGFLAALLVTGIAAGLFYLARRFEEKHLKTVTQPIERRHK